MPSHDGQTVSVNPAQAPKLTKWAREPTAQDLIKDLDAARPAHDSHVTKVNRWNDLLKVDGKAKAPIVKGRSKVQPKLIRRQAEWRYSALTEPFNSSDKMFDVKPSTFEDENSARQNELVLNWQFRTKINRVRFIDDYVRANVDEGSAIVRVGWSRITKEVTEDAPVWTYSQPTEQSQIEQLEAAMQLKEKDPRGYNETVPIEIQKACAYFEETGQPSVARQTGTEKIKIEKVLDNRPLVRVVNPQNIYFDPTCGSDFEKSTFTIESFETSKSELMKEPKRYKNLDKVNWEAASANTEPHHKPVASSSDTNFNFADAMRKKVVAYEFWGVWDVHGTGVMVPIVGTWISGVMIRLEENPFPDQKPPYIVVNYMPVKRELLGEPDAELLEDNQAILGAVTRGMIDLLGRSANGQQGFAKNMLDVVNRRRFEAGQDYEFNPNLPPNQGHLEHKYPEIPQSAMLMIGLQNQEAEALTGVKSFAGGVSGEAFGQVAAGIRGVLDASSKREMAILRRLADGIVRIGEKISAMNAVFLSEEETVRITNTDFVVIKREELAGNFDLEVDIATAEIDNSKSQDLAFMLQTMGPNGDFGITKMILMEIARLKRMYPLVEQLKRFQPKPDPLKEALNKAEVAKLEAEIRKLESEIRLNDAKAKQSLATAEQIDLDTVEQESGTKHARGIEAAGAQAEANQNLEVTKALVRPKKKVDGGETDPNIEAAVGWNQLSKKLSDPRAKNTPVPAAPMPMVPAPMPLAPEPAILPPDNPQIIEPSF